jgi:hypothetical protein
METARAICFSLERQADLRACSRAWAKTREENRREDGDNGDDHEQLDQRKPFFPAHGLPPWLT